MSLREQRATRRPDGFRSSRAGYTLTEMMVVAGIVILVAGISIPLMTPFLRGGAVREASDIFKMACVTARSLAVQQNEDQDLLIVAEQYEQSVQVLSAPRLDDPATATSAGSTTITTSTTLKQNEYEDDPDSGEPRYFVTVIRGRGRGQTRGIEDNTADTITLKTNWEVTPAAGSEFQIYRTAERKVSMPENTYFDFTPGVRVYTFMPMGTISLNGNDDEFAIEDIVERQAQTDIAGGASESEVRRGNWRNFQLYTSTGMVYSEQKER